MKSSVVWEDARVRLPDDDMTVLVSLADGEVWTGFREGGIWRYVSADAIEAEVKHWAAFPDAPGADSPPCDDQEQGWKNKWECAVEMAARAECKLEEARTLHAYANEQRKAADNARMNAEETVNRLEKERGELSAKLDRIMELTTHDDTYWAIEEIGRLCDFVENAEPIRAGVDSETN